MQIHWNRTNLHGQPIPSIPKGGDLVDNGPVVFPWA